MRIVVVLPEPFGPEEAVDGAVRHEQVDVVDGHLAAAEPLGQPPVAGQEVTGLGAAPAVAAGAGAASPAVDAVIERWPVPRRPASRTAGSTAPT